MAPAARLIPYGTLPSPLRASTVSSERESAEFLLRTLEANGFRLNPSSRLARYHRILARGDGEDRSGPALRALAADLDEWDQILSTLPLNNRYWREKVSEALSGSPDLRPGTNSLPRNVQFELFTAASMRQAGVAVHAPARVERSGACIDFEVIVGKYRMGVEAKRVSSPGKLQERLREAEHQLRSARLSGIIALDMTHALPETTVELEDWHAAAAAHQQLRETVFEVINKFDRRLDRWLVLGVWVYCRRSFHLRPPHRKPVTMCEWFPIQTVDPTDRRRKLVAQLQAVWMTRERTSRAFPVYRG